MFSPGSSAARPSFSLNLNRPSSSRGRSDHTPASSAKGSISKVKTCETIEISRVRAPNTSGFSIKGGKRHHSYDDEVAPYPLNYDPKIIDLDVLEHVALMQSRKNVTYVDFKDKPPKRSLDLGCGTGVWVLDAAKQWKDCQFVGFDLVHIQPSADLLLGLADRIQWVHGNFLTGMLPFEDNSFDHVHVHRIGWGVGEIQWDGLFAEIVRVLCPGGAVEMIEEDILFPTLPRSYTIKTKQPRPAAPYPRPSLTLSPPPSPMDDQRTPDGHAHVLLESLFFGVFESRMINLRPISIIPHHLNIYFRNVLTTPKHEYPFPPPPLSRQQLRHVPSDCTERPRRRQSDGSETSLLSPDTTFQQQQQTPPSTNSSLSSLSESSIRAQELSPAGPSRKPIQDVIGSFVPTSHPDVALLPPVLMDVNDRSLALHLNFMYQRILACKEAMWEELCRRLRLRRTGGQDLLHEFGWDEDQDDGGDSSDSGYEHDGPGWSEAQELERARVKFEELIVRFEQDLRYRTALADAVETDLGWTKPAPAPLSKHERTRKAELERAIADAAKAEAEAGESQQIQCSRAVRGFVGFKEGKR